jgi:predicted RNA binding protein YcfA (HicA-like mRNA interferase family)
LSADAMSVEHLDLLHEQLPELFAVKELPENWDDDLVVVSIPDVELIAESADAMFGEANASATYDAFDPPEGLILDQVGPNYIDLSVQPPILSEEIIQVLGGTHGGGPVLYTDRSKMPPPDCLAFYLPYHYYHPDWWGIYLTFEGVLWLAAEIIRRSGNGVNSRQAFEASRLFLYYHEAFHHKTECFSTRLELTHREAFYKKGFEQYFRQTFLTKDCLEEGLANAAALIETLKKTKNSKIDDALAGYVDESPPGYDQGNKLRRVFRRMRCEFAEKNQRVCLAHLPFKDPEIWNTAPHLFDGIANIKSNVNYILSRRSPLAARLPFRPCLPPRNLIKKLRDLVGLEKVREGSRHEVWKTAAGHIVEIPRHARDLGRGLLRNILHQAGVDMGLDEFLRT